MIVCVHCGREFADFNAASNHYRATHDNPEWHKTKAAAKARLKANWSGPIKGAQPQQIERGK